jgi:mycothiol synthase
VWHARPLDDSDIEAVVAMVNECELADSGEVMLEAADLVSDLNRLDRQHDAVVVVRAGRIAGWGMLWQARKRLADVRPDARGQGIGEWLLKWSGWRARALHADRIGQTIDDARTDVAAWLRDHGYTARYTSWILTAPARSGEHDAVPASAAEVEEVLGLFETAFSEHADRMPVPARQWRATTVERPGFTPEDLLVVRAGGRPVGAAFLINTDEVWVDKLAVDAAHRGQGLARELLAAAQDHAAGLGHSRVRLSTDSNAGALEVYTRLGMTVERSFTHYALDL